MTIRIARNAPIGIFDSGPGGLAVLREVNRIMPSEDILYIGDTARQPYGPRPHEEVERFAVELTGYLAQQGAKLIIIGCNTASIAGWEAARRTFPEVPVLGMVRPGVRAALVASRTKRIGVWGTKLTIDSKTYDELIKQNDPEVYVQGVATPTLLRLAEKGQIDNRNYLRELSDSYFEPLANRVDTLILGCTDLTCVRDIVESSVGNEVTVVDPAESVALEAQQILQNADALRTSQPAKFTFQITGDNADEFAKFAAMFLGMSQINVDWVDLREVQ